MTPRVWSGPLARPVSGALLALDVAAVALVASGAHGPARLLLVLAFASLVPGGALLAHWSPNDPVAAAAGVVAASWAVTVLVNDLFIELRWWRPDTVFFVVASVSALSLVAAFWRARTSAIEPAPQPTAVVIDHVLAMNEIELSEPLPALVRPQSGGGTGSVRLLVRRSGDPLGFATVDLHDGRAAVADILEVVGAWPASALSDDEGWRDDAERPFASVVICTRDRTDALETCLASMQRLRYPSFEVIVVDNAAATTGTAELVQRLAADDPRLRYVSEPRPGLSRARNRGVQEATGAVVAFTDDDTTADPWWLHGLLRGFGRDGRVGCVTGLVPAATLTGAAQQQFERRVSWASSCEPALYDLRRPPEGLPLFPYAAGRYGTGANMAFRREALVDTGPFDEALGAGSLARGGEDLDMFVRVLRAHRSIAYEPSAIVWHAHRDSAADLQAQLYAYGVGLTAYLTKQLSDPRRALGVIRRLPQGVRHARSLLERNPGTSGRRLRWAEARGMVRGPLAYVRGRRALRRRGA